MAWPGLVGFCSLGSEIGGRRLAPAIAVSKRNNLYFRSIEFAVAHLQEPALAYELDPK